MSFSTDMITLIAGIVRKGNPDKKQAIPIYPYVERHHVSKGRFLRSYARRGTFTLTLIQVVIPRVHRYAYSAALENKFRVWTRSCEIELVEVPSIAQMIVECSQDNKCPYVINVVQFTCSEPSPGIDNTFGAQIVLRQLPLPIIWGYVADKYTDSITLAEMTGYKAAYAQGLQRTRALLRRQIHITDDTQRAGVSTRHRTSMIGVEALRSCASRSATLMCICCCEVKPMRVLNCGHMCCKACIEMNVNVTQKRLCFICKTEWTFHLPIDTSNLIPDDVCAVCQKPRMYLMICGHATCECRYSVCSTCNTGATVRVFV